METTAMNNRSSAGHSYKVEDGSDHEDELPGFRFHPTDEELVGFYLRRKVDKKPLSIELIRQIDIYKHDPWDLPKISSTEDREGYFFCKRGRKYRNSIRPNRVTGSGFWKATGIDKPVYSEQGSRRHCIGLKKTLVYYRGAAGRGTKTDWMMNELRLPSDDPIPTNSKTKTLQEAEVWTVCRIFQRNVSSRKYTAQWREQQSSATATTNERLRHSSLPSSTITYTINDHEDEAAAYISFQDPPVDTHNIHSHFHCDYKLIKPAAVDDGHIRYQRNDQLDSCGTATAEQLSRNTASYPHESMASSSSTSYPNHAHENHDHHRDDQFLTYENWDELRSVIDFAFHPPVM